MMIVFLLDIQYKIKIGKGTVFLHYTLEVLIHPKVVIGENCKILHNVTIGGRSNFETLPIIGDNVLIGTGAILIGNIKVGNNAVIGAGAVVVNDVPDNAVVVGNPAKVIKYISN